MLRALVLAGVLAVCAGPAAAELRYQWQDTFIAAQRAMLTEWLDDTHRALVDLVGPLPFPVTVQLQSRRAREPVPWARTQRGRQQGVSFFVDTRFPAAEFAADWTAAHELSHLVLPYLGRERAWIAEGFASYMQYQVMMRAGTLTAAQAADRYRSRIERAARRYRGNQPFARGAAELRARYDFPTMYWGGAVLFLTIADELADRDGPDMIAVLRGYLACCRTRDGAAGRLFEDLDRVSGTEAFTTTLRRFEQRPGFPPFEHLDALTVP